MTTFVTFVQSFIGHALFVGFFLLLIHYSTLDDGKLTQTIHFNHLGSSSTPQVCVQRNNTSSHRCNWCCHQNFDNNNCPLLCGDHCIHPYCMNHYRPYLFPPPNPTPFPSTSASLPFQTISAPIPRQYHQSIRVHPLQSIHPSNTQTFIDTPHSYGLLHHLLCQAFRHGPSSNLPNSFRGNEVDAAQTSFRELVDKLEEFISDSVLIYV